MATIVDASEGRIEIIPSGGEVDESSKGHEIGIIPNDENMSLLDDDGQLVTVFDDTEAGDRAVIQIRHGEEGSDYLVVKRDSRDNNNKLGLAIPGSNGPIGRVVFLGNSPIPRITHKTPPNDQRPDDRPPGGGAR